MKLYAEDRKTTNLEGTLPMPHEHPDPKGPRKPPLPPHEKRALLRIQFDDADNALLQDIFGDEDTASAATAVIENAPPEIQILAVQILDYLMNNNEEVA